MPIRLLVFDIDGSFASTISDISTEHFDFIQMAKELNFQILFITGRNCEDFKRFATKLQLTGVHGCLSGAVAFDGKSCSWAHRFTQSEMTSLLALNGLDVYFYGYSNIFLAHDKTSEIAPYEVIEGKRISVLNGSMPDEPIYKAIVIGNFLSFALSGLEARQVAPAVFEINPAGVNKGSFLKNILKLLQVSEHEVISFINSENDLPITKLSKYSFFVGSNFDIYPEGFRVYLPSCFDALNFATKIITLGGDMKKIFTKFV